MKIAVFGAGTMGRGIAQVLIQSGVEVLIFDLFESNPDLEQFVKKEIWLNLFFARNKDGRSPLFESNEVVEQAFQKINFYQTCDENFAHLVDCDAVVEAISENIVHKKMLYKSIEPYINLSGTVPAVLFTNTSTLKILSLADGLQYPEYFMGLHFFNPVPLMKLVEAIPHEETSKSTVVFAEYLVSRLGKKIFLAPDIPGFVANRILVPMLIAFSSALEKGGSPEAIDRAFTSGLWASDLYARPIVEFLIQCAEELVSRDQNQAIYKVTPEQIDEILRLGAKMPLGPFGLKNKLAELEKKSPDDRAGIEKEIRFEMGPGKLCDLVGVDVAVDCCEMLKLQEEGEKWSVSPIFRKMIQDGKRGRKSGQGFYDYNNGVILEFINEGAYALVRWGSMTVPRLVIQQLTQTLEVLKDRPGLKGVIIALERCRGADIREFPLALRDFRILREVIKEWHKLMKTIRDFPLSVVATIKGSALGGGYEIALACDHIIAQKDALIGLPEVGLGILPGGGGTQHLPRRIGLEKALWMILLAEKIKAAHPWVDEIVEKIEPSEIAALIDGKNITKKVREPMSFMGDDYSKANEVIGLALEKWKNKPPASFNLAIDAIMEGNKKPVIEGMEEEFSAIEDAFETKDAETGIRSILERKDPVFRGE